MASMASQRAITSIDHRARLAEGLSLKTTLVSHHDCHALYHLSGESLEQEISHME